MSFSSLIALVQKDLKMFFRSRVSAVVVLLIPLLIVLFAGFAFDSSSLTSVQVGVYSEGYTPFSKGIISDFQKQGFVSKEYKTNQTCVDSVKHSESQICIIFPKGLTKDSADKEIIFYADYSRINLADSLINEIKGNVQIKSSGIGEAKAQNLINLLEEIKKNLPSDKSKVDQAITTAKQSSQKVSSIASPTDQVASIITELNSIKDDLDGNYSSQKKEIEDIVTKLTDIDTKGKNLKSSLSQVSSQNTNVVTKLNEVSKQLNQILIKLSSSPKVSANNIVSPIKTKIESVNTSEKNRDYIIPIVFSLIALFGSILLSSTFVLKGKKTKAFFRNFMTPTKDILFIIGTYITCVIILLIQFILVFIGMKFILGIEIIPIIFSLFVVLFTSISVFVVIGMFIGYLFRSDETIIFASMIIAALFMFFSNVILPLENASAGLLRVLKFNPLVLSNLAFKKIVLFNFGLPEIQSELMILGIFFATFFILSFLFRRLTRRVL